jgi:hypothetical protein
MHGAVAGVLVPLGLRLAMEKTRVVQIDEGFDFLSFHIRRIRSRTRSVSTTSNPMPWQMIVKGGRWPSHRCRRCRPVEMVALRRTKYAVVCRSSALSAYWSLP